MNIPHVTEIEIGAVKRLGRCESDDLKNQINRTHPNDIFGKAKESNNDNVAYIICPNCHNGTGKDKTPVKCDFKGDRWLYHCFAHGDLEGDLLSLIAKEENLILSNPDDMVKALAIGANIIGYNLTDADSFKKDLKAKKKSKRPLITFNEFKPADEKQPQQFDRLAESQTKLQCFFNAYKTFRGLSKETVARLNWGFLSDYKHPDNDFVFEAVIIPNDKGGILARAIKGNAKSNISPTATTTVCRPTDNNIIFVVEGAIDAASIAQVTNFKYGVIAIGGTTGIKNCVARLSELYSSKSVKPKIIVMLDNDSDDPNDFKHNPGQDAAHKLIPELLQLRFPVVNKIISDTPRRDPNTILNEKNGEEFLRNRIEEIVSESQSEFALAEKKISDSILIDEQISEWQTYNGNINPELLPKLKKAKEYLDGLNEFTINAANAQSSTTKHALALCKFYDCFAATVDKFYVKLAAAKTEAATAIKQMKDEGGEFVASPPVELQMLIKVSVRDLKAAVEPLVTKYKKAHAVFCKEELRRQNRELIEQKRANQILKKESQRLRLEELLSEDETPQRNEEIIELLKELCEWKHDKQGNPTEIKATAANMRLIFTYDPYISKLFGYDEFQDAPVFLKQALWRKNPCINKEWTDIDDSELRIYLRETYKELSNKDLINDYFNSYCSKNSFHVVKNFLKSLPQWDGVSRLEELFIKFLNVDDTPYTRSVTKNWLIAAIARIFNPGCRYQTALVLQGNQGIGKSYIIEQLGGQWYMELTENVDDSHADDAVKKGWIIELKEMSPTRKADINAVKAFIERASDTRRLAYARRASTSFRHCVFAITVNDEQFLRDPTGNRRYLILKCHRPARSYVEGLTDEYIQQIWAEAYHLYNEMFVDGFDERKLELKADIRNIAEEIAENYVRDDGMKGEIVACLENKILPPVLWDLLTRAERRDFIKNGRLVMTDAVTEFNHRRRARGGRADCVQRDVDLISNYLEPSQSNHWLRIEHKTIQGVETDEYILYGSDYREHICAAEIFNECFGNDKRKSMQRIHEVLSQIEGWHKDNNGKRIRNDRAYGDQKTIYYRDIDNQPEDRIPNQYDSIQTELADNYTIPFDPNDLPI